MPKPAWGTRARREMAERECEEVWARARKSKAEAIAAWKEAHIACSGLLASINRVFNPLNWLRLCRKNPELMAEIRKDRDKAQEKMKEMSKRPRYGF